MSFVEHQTTSNVFEARDMKCENVSKSYYYNKAIQRNRIKNCSVS